MGAEIADAAELAIRTFLDQRSVSHLLHELRDGERTTAFKTVLRDCARNLMFKVAASRCDADEGEWLYDMVWYRNSRDGYYEEQGAVIECEWRNGIPVASSDEVDGDFQKLVQARADLRIWICTIPNLELAKRHIANCIAQIQRFRGTVRGDSYLFVILIWSHDEYYIERYDVA
jgi:hypothetical protein